MQFPQCCENRTWDGPTLTTFYKLQYTSGSPHTRRGALGRGARGLDRYSIVDAPIFTRGVICTSSIRRHSRSASHSHTPFGPAAALKTRASAPNPPAPPCSHSPRSPHPPFLRSSCGLMRFDAHWFAADAGRSRHSPLAGSAPAVPPLVAGEPRWFQRV